MSESTTIAAALALGRAAHLDSQTTSLAAQVLLARQLGVTRAWLLAHPETALAASATREYTEQGARRAAGEPLV